MRFPQIQVRCGGAVLASGLLLAACSQHIQPYEPKRRDWRPPVAISENGPQRAAPGSLWPVDGRSRVVDWGDRPSRMGDLVNVQIEEHLTAQGEASTELERQAEYEAKIKALLGLVEKVQQATGMGESVIGASAENQFKGAGKVRRENSVVATVPSMVIKVLSNGNLFIEGHRVILLNQEENHFYISGVIRPVDIDAGNIVKSSRIADAEIEITGRGVIAESNNPGWFSRLLQRFWPF